MSKYRYSGDYSGTVYTMLAGSVSAMLESNDRAFVADALERHARRLRHDAEEDIEPRMTVMPYDSSLEHINWVVIDGEGEEYLVDSLETVRDVIDDELGGGD